MLLALLLNVGADCFFVLESLLQYGYSSPDFHIWYYFHIANKYINNFNCKKNPNKKPPFTSGGFKKTWGLPFRCRQALVVNYSNREHNYLSGATFCRGSDLSVSSTFLQKKIPFVIEWVMVLFPSDWFVPVVSATLFEKRIPSVTISVLWVFSPVLGL